MIAGRHYKISTVRAMLSMLVMFDYFENIMSKICSNITL